MTSPYILPEGNVQIAFSGGRTSAYMLRQIIDANGGLPDRCKVIFTNTGREMPETLDFVAEVADRWSVPIVWVEYRLTTVGNEPAHSFCEVSRETASLNGEPFIDVMRYFGFPPNREADFCSHELKTRTAKRWCMDVLGWAHWTTALGIRADEKERVMKTQPRERYKVWYPLNNAKVTKRTVSAFWDKQPFQLRLQTIKGVTPHGNCDGCFKKSEAKRAALARDFPDRAEWWAEQEARFSGTFLEGQKWEQLISFVDRQGDWIFDAQDVLCQANDGECMA
jgi:3'-phosphoadenosine 5'-phosphosulfate sulfotransferase (PAPS reductase)/FAD synthetase